jgi:hypothetical protein
MVMLVEVSKVFKLLLGSFNYGAQVVNELQLYSTAIGGLVMAAAMFFLVGSTTTKVQNGFQNVESMLNHHLAGLLGLGSLAWAGHKFTFLYLLISY